MNKPQFLPISIPKFLEKCDHNRVVRLENRRLMLAYSSEYESWMIATKSLQPGRKIFTTQTLFTNEGMDGLLTAYVQILKDLNEQEAK
ncbi:hypothetical protein OAV22_02085 [Flavobacteriaceae bacterium]|nr:hypothetical protein [Flavobacteriaceae bacterium]